MPICMNHNEMTKSGTCREREGRELTSEMYNGTREVLTPMPIPTINRPKTIISTDCALALHKDQSTFKGAES
jgi:hypothetical protein